MKLSKLFEKIAGGFKSNRFVINQGGTSSGKTYSTLQFLIVWALRSEKIKLVSIVAESIPHLKRGAYRDFLKILMEAGLYREDNHNKTDFTYKLGNFHFEFFSADNDAKLRGARRDVLYVNECNNISWDAFTQLEIRTRDKIFLDFNPVSRFWVHKKVMQPSQKYSFIKSTYKDNVDHLTGKPLLEQSIIDAIESRKPVYDSEGNLLSGDEQFWKVYGLGEVGSLEGVIFSNWDTVDTIPSDGKWTAYGLDFGFTNDPTAIVKIVYQGGELWIEELVFEQGLTNPDIVTRLKSFGVGSLDDIIADSSEPKSIAEIRRGGFRACRGVKKGPDSITNGIDILKRYKLNIHKKSVNLIDEFSNYQWMKTKDGDYLNKPIDKYNHCFVGETLITTFNGTKQIKDISTGDIVLTSNGYNKVLKKFNNGKKQVFKYCLRFDTFCLYLTSTENHKIKTSNGWINISELKKGMTLFLHNNSTKKHITNTKVKDISQKELKSFIGLFGNFIMDLYRKVIMYTTKTETRKTTTSKTLILLKNLYIFDMKVKKGLKTIQYSQKNFNKKESNLQKNGINQKTEKNGIKSTQKCLVSENGTYQQKNVNLAKINSSRKHTTTNFAQTNVKAHGEGNPELTTSQSIVSYAEVATQKTNIQSQKLVQIDVVESYEEEVFDFMVENEHEYFANGVLVHNCIDAVRYVCFDKIGMNRQERKGIKRRN